MFHCFCSIILSFLGALHLIPILMPQLFRICLVHYDNVELLT